MKKRLALAGLLAWAMSSMAAPVTADGYTHVKSVGAIDEYTLKSNGLQVLLLPDHSTPTLTFMVTYRVGSRNEVTGTTGATHILEHLMFKGSAHHDRVKGNNVDQLLERSGARYNANTWLDRTSYFENLGSEHLAMAMDMEADRMRNLLLRDSDRKPEMTVVRNEFERGENSPTGALEKEIYQAAFTAHPYHHSTIGHRSDIEKVSIEKLREFYNTFYWPNNATVTIVGDFDPAKALAMVQQHFGKYPHSPKPIPEMYTEEPEQTGPRRVTVKRAGQLGVVAVAYKVPGGSQADYPAVAMLNAILTDGKNSRMYKALTNKNLTTSVDGDLGLFHDTSMDILYANLAPGAKADEVEALLLQEVERVKQDGVTEAELKAAIAKEQAAAAFKRDGSFAVAGDLTECIAAGDWTLFYNLPEAIKKVTVADVQRVAKKYFQVDQSTTGVFVPTAAAGGGAKPAAKPALMAEDGTPEGTALEGRGPHYYRTPGVGTPAPAPTLAPAASAAPAGGAAAQASKMAVNVKRSKIAGIDVIAYPMAVQDVVTLRASLPVGKAHNGKGNPAIATLTGMMLDQGTQKQDKFAIAEKLESVGASLRFRVDNDTLDITARMLKKDVPLVLGLLAEELRTPAFSPEEFAKTKRQYAGTVKRALENTDFRAADALTRAVYPEGHPNRNPAPEELAAAIDAAKLDDVVAFHKANYGPAHMTLVLVGDLDMAAVQAEMDKSFAGWSGGSDVVHGAKAPATSAQMLDVQMADKTSVSLVIGQASGLRYSDPDYQALRLATAILGSGFTGRLMGNVRDKEGLTYGIGAGLGNDDANDGDWRIAGTFAPSLLDKGIVSTQRQLKLWYDQGATPAEISARKSNLVGGFKVGLATTGGMANVLLATVNRGYDQTWLDDFPAKVNALTDAQVNGAIKKYLKPDAMVMVKAGTLPGTEKK
jgi:zinc protease